MRRKHTHIFIKSKYKLFTNQKGYLFFLIQNTWFSFKKILRICKVETSVCFGNTKLHRNVGLAALKDDEKTIKRYHINHPLDAILEPLSALQWKLTVTKTLSSNVISWLNEDLKEFVEDRFDRYNSASNAR